MTDDFEIKNIKGKLYSVDKKNQIIHSHRPFSKIDEFRKISKDIIIVRERTENYDPTKSNIYCLDSNLKIRWFSEQPFDNDTFPNPIVWDKELNDKETSSEDYMVDNGTTLTCSSWKGFTVSIDYESGKITKLIFTK